MRGRSPIHQVSFDHTTRADERGLLNPPSDNPEAQTMILAILILCIITGFVIGRGICRAIGF